MCHLRMSHEALGVFMPVLQTRRVIARSTNIGGQGALLWDNLICQMGIIRKAMRTWILVILVTTCYPWKD